MLRSISSVNEDIIFIGRKQGLEIYMTGATETSVIVRPGALHINNGFQNRVLHIADFTTVDLSGFTKATWVFITCDDSGTIRGRQSTGGAAITARPSDDVYGWVDGDNTKFKHHKQGYYWLENERIIGAVWIAVTTGYATYIINNGSGSDEVGENSRGQWERRGRKQAVELSLSFASATGTSGAFGNTSGNQFYGSGTATFPLAFTVAPRCVCVVDDASSYGFTSNVGTVDVSSCIIYTCQAATQPAVPIRVYAKGYWHA